MRAVKVALVALFALCLAVLSIAPVRAEEGKNTIDIFSIVQKAPAFIPLFVAKVRSESCKSDLRVFKDDVERVLDRLGKSKQPLLSDLKGALCKLPRTCAGEVLEVIKKMASNGGFVENMVKMFLKNKGLDFETADIMMLAYIENMCSTEDETEEELNARLDEL